MVHIDWRIQWDTDRLPDPIHPCDWVVLSTVVLALAFFSLALLLVALRRNTVSVRKRRAWSLVLMIIGSVTHIVAEYVSNAHLVGLPLADNVRNFHCTFWDFWMKYGAGLNLWFVGQAGRLFAWYVSLELRVTYDDAQVVEAPLIPISHDAELYDPRRDKHTSCGDRVRHFLNTRRYMFLRALFCCALALPAVVLCVVVESTHGTRYSSTFDWCVAQPVYVILIIAWLLLCEGVLFLLLWRMRQYDRRELLTYRGTRDSAVIGLVCLVVLVVANRLELSVFWWGRAFTTWVVIALYVLTYLRVASDTFTDAAVYGLTTENPQAERNVTNDLENILSGEETHPTLKMLLNPKRLYLPFLTWLRKQPLLQGPADFNESINWDQLTDIYAERFTEVSRVAVQQMVQGTPRQHANYFIEDTAIAADDKSTAAATASIVNPELIADFILYYHQYRACVESVHVDDTSDWTQAFIALRLLLLTCFPIEAPENFHLLANEHPDTTDSSYHRIDEDPVMEVDPDTGLLCAVSEHAAATGSNTTTRGSAPPKPPNRGAARNPAWVMLNQQPYFLDSMGTETVSTIAQFFEINIRDMDTVRARIRTERVTEACRQALPITDDTLFAAYLAAARCTINGDPMHSVMHIVRFLVEHKWLRKFCADKDNMDQYLKFQRKRVANVIRQEQLVQERSEFPVSDEHDVV